MSQHGKHRKSSRSRSRSSSKSSSRSSRTPSAGKTLRKKSTQSSDTVNFFSFVSGIVTSLLLISICYSGFRPNDVVDEGPKSVVITGNEVSGISTFDKVLSDGTKTEVVQFLRMLNKWPKDATLPVKVEYQEKRIGMAKRLLELEPTPSERRLAIDAQIDAASSFYGLDFLNEMNTTQAAASLTDAATPYLEDKNNLIRRSAKLGLSKLRVFEFAKNQSDANFQPARDIIFSTIEDFPNDSFVIGNLRVLIQRLVRDDIENGRELIEEFYRRYENSDSELVQSFARELNDTLIIADSNYANLVINRFANGAAGRKDLHDATIELAKNVDGGPSLINRLGATIDWFEQVNDFEKAKSICNTMLESADNHKDKQAIASAKRLANAGLKRVSMVDKKLILKGDSNQGPLDPAEFDDRITIVIFFQEDERSGKAVRNLIKLKRDVAARGIQMLGVSLDPDISDTIEKIAEKAPQWKFLMAEKGDPPSNPILDQYPVVTGPHTILLDHQGRVKRLNVQLADIHTYIDELVSTRRSAGRPN